jgi:hypothetical protein
MALAETRNNQELGVAFDDVVEGKGQGLNVLLQYGSSFSLGP